jgi:IPT/TIG domain.
MKQTKQRFIFLALAALLALFAGCKGESPTAPPPITGTSGGGTGTGTGTQPPTGASIALAVTSAAPFTGSTSTIIATVTQNNATVPNGTAVEFATTTANANFTDTTDNPTTLIRTTTSGVAKATVTSSVAGPVVVTVTVNNVTKSITLTFQDVVIPPVLPSNAPTISSVTPTSGLPTGNQSVVITGTNFRTPVRVLFDPGSGQAAKEAFVTNTNTAPAAITVISPAFDLGVSQQLVVSITVIVEAGLPTEQRVTKAAAFTYTAPVLTPVVRAISPTSGPIDGGTRITITGDAFEAPVQVFFGSAQAQVLSVVFHEIDVLSPTARETNPNGSGTVTGPVELRILNVNSGKSVSVPAGFRYVNKMQITSVSPTFGSALGGTSILIDGIGFTDGATVDVGDFRASVIKVTGTEVTARTASIPIPCTGTSRLDVKVTNIDNGDTATQSSVFSYVGVPSIITSVTGPSPTNIGNALAVNVQNPGVGLLGTATVAFTVGGLAANVTPQQISAGTGTQAFTVIVPPGLTFPTVACLVGIIPGTKLGDVTLPVTFTNLTTGCTATAANAITISPLALSNPCVVPPPAASLTSPAQTCPTPPNLTPASVAAAGVNQHTATITIANTGGQTLTLGAPSVTLVNATGPSSNISPTTGASVAPGGGTTSYTITVDPAAVGADGATITFTTNDPTKPTLTVTVCGSGT